MPRGCAATVVVMPAASTMPRWSRRHLDRDSYGTRCRDRRCRVRAGDLRSDARRRSAAARRPGRPLATAAAWFPRRTNASRTGPAAAQSLARWGVAVRACAPRFAPDPARHGPVRPAPASLLVRPARAALARCPADGPVPRWRALHSWGRRGAVARFRRDHVSHPLAPGRVGVPAYWTCSPLREARSEWL